MISRLFLARPNWNMLLNRIGSHNSEIASVGEIISVKRPIAAAGSPMPRNPLTMPANTKMAQMLAINSGSRVGRRACRDSEFTLLFWHQLAS